jgi:putative Mg2+ transporter-C (MgtC) family protein
MVSTLEILIRFSLALIWGGLVGAEREYRGKAAGFRTTIMISIGACFFTLMSVAIGGIGHSGNPDRIASNIVTGIGFLGAGVIFRGENRINGITTAATIWAVAAVGMGIGAGYYLAAGCASILILFILIILPYLQKYIDKLHQYRMLTVRCQRDTDVKHRAEKLMHAHELKKKLLRRIVDGKHAVYTWQISGKEHHLNIFIEEMMKDAEIEKMEC